MNEIFEFRKKLNMRKIIFLVVISLFIIVICFEIISGFFKKDTKNNIQNPTSIFYDENKSISITLPNTYGLQKITSNANYLLELTSSNELSILISHKNIINSRKLSDVVFADRSSYIKHFESVSNITEISNIPVHSKLPAYTYNFNFKINDKKFNLQTIWIENTTGYFVIDIKKPVESEISYTNLINEVTSSFTIQTK